MTITSDLVGIVAGVKCSKCLDAIGDSKFSEVRNGHAMIEAVSGKVYACGPDGFGEREPDFKVSFDMTPTKVDLTPTWRGQLAACTFILDAKSNADSYQAARDEILRAGQLLDDLIDDRKANAALTAATPQMLAALKSAEALVDYIRGHKGNISDDVLDEWAGRVVAEITPILLDFASLSNDAIAEIDGDS